MFNVGTYARQYIKAEMSPRAALGRHDILNIYAPNDTAPRRLIFAANRNKSRRVKILVYKIVHEFLQRRPFCD